MAKAPELPPRTIGISLSDAVDAARTSLIQADGQAVRATPGPGRGKKTGSNTTRFNGRDTSYLAARLKRDHPDIAARVANGEFKSIRAAALEAGIVKPMRSIPVDTPEAAIRALLRVKARLRCEDPDCGIKGENPNIRFGRWVSTNFGETKRSQRIYEARRLWEVFGQRQEEVARFAPHH